MSGSIKFMTYNVWSWEHVAVYRRIKSICEIIQQHDPDVIFLQEVTEYIYSLFREAPWWEKYATKFPSSKEKYQKPSPSSKSNSNPSSFCLLLSKNAGPVVLPEYHTRPSPSPYEGFLLPKRFPPAGSIPEDLVSAWVYTKRHRLRAATCRLPSPSPLNIGCVHRRAWATAFLEHFDAVHQPPNNKMSFVVDENVVLGGDLGWNDDLDGSLRLGDEGWVDAWMELRGGEAEAGGWTYDADANPMLMGFNLPADRRRPDRFICKLRDFTLESIEMLGVEPIPGVTRLDDKWYPVPVLPSHHFGLLLTIKPKH